MRRSGDEENLFDLIEHLAGPGSLNKWSRVALGILVPVMIAGIGLVGIVQQSITFVAARPLRLAHYAGVEAVALGVAYLAVAVFVHCHCFLMTFDAFYGHGEIGKIIAAALFLGSVGLFTLHVMFYI